MRGRTNVLSGGGEVIVNGQVKEFEVAAGNNISVGDFVSFEKFQQSPTFVENVNTNSKRCFQVYISESVYLQVVQFGGDSHIYLVNGSIVKQKITVNYTSYPHEVFFLPSSRKVLLFKNGYISLCQIDELYENISYIKELSVTGTITCCNDKIVSLSSSSIKCYNLTSDNELNLLNSYSDINVGSESYYKTFCKGSKLHIFNYKYAANTNKVSAKYSVLNVADDGTVSLISTSSNNSVPNFDMMMNLIYTDANNFYIVLEDYSQCSYYKGYNLGYICFYKFDEDNMLQTWGIGCMGYEGTDSTSTNFPYYSNSYDFVFIPINDEFFLCFSATILFNNRDTETTEDEQQNYSVLFYSIYKKQESDFARIGEWIELYRERTVTKHNSYYYAKEYKFSFSYYFKYGNEYELFLGSASYPSNTSHSYIDKIVKINFKVENNVITAISDKVTSYNGSSLGFAKTGGNAGDTIKVYVPYDNN